MKQKISPTIIGLIFLLMVTLIVVQLSVFGFFESNPVVVEVETSYPGLIPRLETEAGMYRGLHNDSPYPTGSKLKSKRRAKQFYKNRAYAGAPPRIPHSVSEVIAEGGFENCLQCHENGSYSIKMKAYAPIAPHPEFINCRQCHVPKKTSGLFKPTEWRKVLKVQSGRRHLPGSPPVIPHSLQLRENCLSCHFGEGALQEIKVSHPERTNCRQCHVETNTMKTFKRDHK
jgi:cytochrome c-type protein NapB